MFLCSGKVASGSKKCVLGVYTTAPMPEVTNATEQSYPVTGKPGDFMFVYVEGYGTYFCKMKRETDPIVYMYTDYEGGGALYCGQ